MAYKLKLSQQAIFDIDEIATDLSSRWSEEIKLDFLVNVSDKLLLLEKMPFIYRKSQSRPNIRECVVNKYVMMYYTVSIEEEIVVILALKNTRQIF